MTVSWLDKTAKIKAPPYIKAYRKKQKKQLRIEIKSISKQHSRTQHKTTQQSQIETTQLNKKSCT